MNTEIAQIIGLVTYANARLQGQDVTFDLNNTLASFNRSIEFVEIPEGGELEDSVVLAKDPPEWIDQLVVQEVERVRVHYTPTMDSEFSDYISVAFLGGGGRWIVEVVDGKTSSLWESGWKATLARGNRLWKTYYVRIAESWKPVEGTIKTVDARRKLESALEEISNFADSAEESRYWTKYFQSAKEDLQKKHPLGDSDYIPKDCLTIEAEQLISASFRAWVFGGMGSWNDMGFVGEMEEEYHRVSDVLYTAICEAIVAAVNSYP